MERMIKNVDNGLPALLLMVITVIGSLGLVGTMQARLSVLPHSKRPAGQAPRGSFVPNTMFLEFENIAFYERRSNFFAQHGYAQASELSKQAAGQAKEGRRIMASLLYKAAVASRKGDIDTVNRLIQAAQDEGRGMDYAQIWRDYRNEWAQNPSDEARRAAWYVGRASSYARFGYYDAAEISLKAAQVMRDGDADQAIELRYKAADSARMQKSEERKIKNKNKNEKSYTIAHSHHKAHEVEREEVEVLHDDNQQQLSKAVVGV